MNAVLDNEKKYSEYLVEYDTDNLVVYVSGLDDDGFWWELDCQTEVNDPESFAQGYAEALKAKGFVAEAHDVSWEFLG